MKYVFMQSYRLSDLFALPVFPVSCFSGPTQPAHNILETFPVCSLSVAMVGTSREHLENILKEKIFLKVLDGKVVFVLKAYDLIITNVDLLANSSNREVMFPEYSRNILSQKYSKDIPGIL